MQTHISILRGINVGGNRILRMADLRDWYANLGFEQVQSFIQSGNLLFRSVLQETSNLESAIARKIFDESALQVPVVVLEMDQLNKIVDLNPFLLQTGINPESLHVTFLSETPSGELLDRIMGNDYLPDQFYLSDKQVYLYCPNGYGNTKLNNHFFESKLKVTATTRNWKTLVQLVNLAKEQQSGSAD